LRRAGFTLVELVIAVAIMAVMLVVGVGISRLVGPDNDLNAVASDVSSSIELARSEAIVSGRRVFFELELGERDSDPQHYRSIKEPMPTREKDAEDEEFLLTVREWRKLPPSVRIDSVVLGEEEPFTRGHVQVAIQPDGSMPSHLIRFWSPEMDPGKSRAAGWACVQVAGLLGQARILNRFVEPEFLTENLFE
jgi:prepilin-type N-terminal cleavage/methylation domain-containing protein